MSNNQEQAIKNKAPDQENGEVQVLEEESTAKRILNTVVNAILVIAIALAALCTYTSYVSSSGSGVPSILGVRMFSIQTESMYPTLLPGDLIFDTAVKDTGELRPGDIITYWTVINGERVLNTHRIEQIYDGGGYLIFSTKGDNNTIADPLTVHESEIVGKYSFRVQSLGKFFDYLQTSTGFLIVVVIPVFLFFLFHLVQFFRVLFEYQNVKNRIKYEQERGRTEDLIEDQKRQQAEAQAAARAKMEAELRERLRAEILASMAGQKSNPSSDVIEPATPAQPVPEEKPAEAAAPVAEEKPAEVAAPVAEEKPAEAAAPVAEEKPAEAAAPVAEEKPAEAAAAPAEEKPAEPAAAPAAPVMDEAAIEALIAKQRAAIEAQLREKIMAEMMANNNKAPAAEPAAAAENAEDNA